jgi:hypothetical protein
LRARDLECPTRSLTLPVLIVRAKALIAGRDACGPGEEAARFGEGKRYGMSYQVTILEALLGTD